MSRVAQTCMFLAGAVLLTAPALHAATTPEQKCQKGRYDAGAKYAACQQKAMAKTFVSGDNGKFVILGAKCQTKYAAVWPKLQAKTPGSTCDTARYTDNGTTVTDNLTGLQWEKKTSDATVHDSANAYSWSAALPYMAADGTAFTTFLPALNSGGCFAGQCDWRLPTIYELRTILLEPFPCTTNPCIDAIFGPTVINFYWSATTDPTIPDRAWLVSLGDGTADRIPKVNSNYVRAVRGGL